MFSQPCSRSRGDWWGSVQSLLQSIQRSGGRCYRRCIVLYCIALYCAAGPVVIREALCNVCSEAVKDLGAAVTNEKLHVSFLKRLYERQVFLLWQADSDLVTLEVMTTILFLLWLFLCAWFSFKLPGWCWSIIVLLLPLLLSLSLILLLLLVLLLLLFSCYRPQWY